MISFPDGLTLLQFAVGGLSYPPPDAWLTIAERFRGRVLRMRAAQFSGRGSYAALDERGRGELALLCGKDGGGVVLQQHRHAYFALWPDARGRPSRLVCWRSSPFAPAEIEALVAAAESPVPWLLKEDVRLVPLPLDTLPPPGCAEAARVWLSATPFVAPRHQARRSGRPRPAEEPAGQLVRFLVAAGFPEPEVRPLDDGDCFELVRVHQTRRQRAAGAPVSRRPGWRFRIRFPYAVHGPICVGHSAHFGLGLFVPES